MSSLPTKLVAVYVASGLEEAHVVKGRLEEEGIPAMLRYESAGMVFGLTVDGLGQVKVVVPERFAAEAKDIIASGDQQDGHPNGRD